MSTDAIIDLWRRGSVTEESFGLARERLEATAASVMDWYEDFAEGFTSTAFGIPAAQEFTDTEVIATVRDELTAAELPDLAAAAKIIWTSDHLNVVQQLESDLKKSAQPCDKLWSQRDFLAPSRK